VLTLDTGSVVRLRDQPRPTAVQHSSPGAFIFVHICTLVYLPRDGREKLRLAAVSAIVFSPRSASVIGGFISRTKNPEISNLKFQNALI
jgi:hypothetical protein